MHNGREALVVLEEVARYLTDAMEEMAIDTLYDEGRLDGYYEALSFLVAQCAVMGIRQDEIGLAGVDPDSLLTAVRAVRGE